MYKGASKKQQHAHRVNAIHPSRGATFTPPDEADVIAEIGAMTIEAVRSERLLLKSQIAQVEQRLAIAKASNSEDERAMLGFAKSVMCLRMSKVNERLNALAVPDLSHAIFEIIRDLWGDEGVKKVAHRLKELKRGA